MNVLLLEDSASDFMRVSALLKKSGANVISFIDARILCDYYNRNPSFPDVAFLDIIIDGKDKNGIDAAAILRKSGFRGPIVFLSSSNEYATESYQVNAFGYILKSADDSTIRQMILDVETSIKETTDKDTRNIVVSFARRIKKIFYRDINYVEVMRNTVVFHLTAGEEVRIYSTLKDISDQLLQDKRFKTTHRSFIVNIDYVKTILKHDAIMMNGKAVPISKSYASFKQDFIKQATE
jgi:DNA-binding LytR/AlgR family response regulator